MTICKFQVNKDRYGTANTIRAVSEAFRGTISRNASIFLTDIPNSLSHNIYKMQINQVTFCFQMMLKCQILQKKRNNFDERAKK